MGFEKFEKTETHEIQRHGGTLTVRVTYTPRTGTPFRIYRLKIEAVKGDGCSTYVFVYHRAVSGPPMEDGSPRDSFLCTADELDEDELPIEQQGSFLKDGIPYYRSSSTELLFRSSDEMYESAKAIISSLAC